METEDIQGYKAVTVDPLKKNKSTAQSWTKILLIQEEIRKDEEETICLNERTAE